jgi:hypothetical protein
VAASLSAWRANHRSMYGQPAADHIGPSASVAVAITSRRKSARNAERVSWPAVAA